MQTMATGDLISLLVSVPQPFNKADTLSACQALLVISSFAMIGIKNPDSWVAAEALYIIGTVGELEH